MTSSSNTGRGTGITAPILRALGSLDLRGRRAQDIAEQVGRSLADTEQVLYVHQVSGRTRVVGGWWRITQAGADYLAALDQEADRGA